MYTLRHEHDLSDSDKQFFDKLNTHIFLIALYRHILFLTVYTIYQFSLINIVSNVILGSVRYNGNTVRLMRLCIIKNIQTMKLCIYITICPLALMLKILSVHCPLHMYPKVTQTERNLCKNKNKCIYMLHGLLLRFHFSTTLEEKSHVVLVL